MPIVFISYSWDSPEHKAWVKRLANRLFENAVDARLDHYDCPPGDNFLLFMEEELTKADRVLLILTKNYKSKADNRQYGVGLDSLALTFFTCSFLQIN